MNGTTDKRYRPGLPAMPIQMQRLPVERGYPVPWFVEKVKGHYDFRVADSRKLVLAVKKRLCWVCGSPLGKEFTFCIGPMCAVNRTSAEPPSHHVCAEFAARACPFLIQKEAHRREGGLPSNAVEPAGEMIRRQPGVVLLWRTNAYTLFPDGLGGTLFEIGAPVGVTWLREAREATRAEVEESIRTGLPLLWGNVRSREEARQLEAEIAQAYTLLPEESVA